MTKADIVTKTDKTGMERGEVQAVVESFMKEIKHSLEDGNNVYLRGFGSFIVKKRAQKTGRNISKTPPSLYRLIIFQHLSQRKCSWKA